MVYHKDNILNALMEEVSKLMLTEKSRKQKKKYDRNRNRRREEQQRREQAKVKLFRPTKEMVISTVNELNEKFFSKQGFFIYPDDISYEMTSLSATENYGYFHYDGKDENDVYRLKNPKISINQDYQYSEDLFRSIVAHEMIHYCQAVIYDDEKGEEIGHDDFFMSLASLINRALGLEVSPTIDLKKFQQENPEVGKPFDGDMQGSEGQQGQDNQQVNPQVFELMSNMVKTFGSRVNNLKKKTQTDNVMLKVLYSNYLRFTNSMIIAMQRCIQARTLNEAQGGWGLETPDFVQNYINGFKSGFNSTTNGVDNFIRKWQYQKYGTRFDKNGNIVLGNKTTLNELLTKYYPPLKEQYSVMIKQDSNLLSDEDLAGIVRETDELCKMANIQIAQPQGNQEGEQGNPEGEQQKENPEQNGKPEEVEKPQANSGETETPNDNPGGEQPEQPRVQEYSPEEQARRKQAYQQRVYGNGRGQKQPNLGQRKKNRRNEDFLREIEDYLFALLD